MAEGESFSPTTDSSRFFHGLPHPSNFRHLAETTSLFGLLLVNVDGRIQSWNRGAFEISGYTREEAVGQALHRFVKIEPKQRYQYDDALWRANQSEDGQYRGRRFVAHKEGPFIPVLVAVNAIRTDHDELLGYGISIRPGAEAEDIERDLQDSLSLLRTIIETLPEPLYVKDREGRYLLVNSAFATSLGLQADKIVQCTDDDLYSVDICAMQAASDREVIENQQRYEIEYTLERGHTSYVIHTTKLPFYNASGQICGVIALSRDVTKERNRDAERDDWLTQEQDARKRAEGMLQRLEVIHSISDHAMGHLDPTSLIENLLETARWTLNADTIEFWMINTETRQLTPYLRLGFNKDDEGTLIAEQKIELGSGILGEVASSGKQFLCDDRREHEPGQLFESPEIRAFIATPVFAKTRVLGVIALSSTQLGLFEHNDFYVLNIVADRIANALERRRLFEELSNANAAMHQLSHRMLEAQEEERRHLARELHDEIGQVLTSIKLSLDSIPSGSSPEDLNHHLNQTSLQVDEAIKQVRRLSTGLRPPTLDVLGLEAALRECWDKMVPNAGLQGSVVADSIGRQDNDLEIAIFRIAQESITNVIRHARATRVDVTLRKRQNFLVVTISDDGMGFDHSEARRHAQEGGSYGLRSMEERALLLGGTLEVRSRRDKGTTLRATFPIDPGARSMHVDRRAREYANASRHHRFESLGVEAMATETSQLRNALKEAPMEENCVASDAPLQ